MKNLLAICLLVAISAIFLQANTPKEGQQLLPESVFVSAEQPDWIVLRDQDGNVIVILDDDDPCNWNYYTDLGPGNGWKYNGSDPISGCGG